MQLIRLWLKEFRNLKDIEIRFAQTLDSGPSSASSRSEPICSHALIGQNGTGKSNLMEALIHIFRNIDLDQPAPFDYALEYAINEQQIKITADTCGARKALCLGQWRKTKPGLFS